MPPHHISRYSDKTLQNIAKIFSLELIEIHHENIQKEHINMYKNTMWAKMFLSTKLIDTSLLRKLINKLGIIGRNFIKIPKNGYGQTVIAIYKLKR